MGCLAPSTPSRRWKKDAHHLFLIRAIDKCIRQRKYTPVTPPVASGVNTGRSVHEFCTCHLGLPWSGATLARGLGRGFSGLDSTWNGQHGASRDLWASADSTSCTTDLILGVYRLMKERHSRRLMTQSRWGWSGSSKGEDLDRTGAPFRTPKP